MEPFQTIPGLFDVFDMFDVYGRFAITAIKSPIGLVETEWMTLSQFWASAARLRVCYHVLSLLELQEDAGSLPREYPQKGAIRQTGGSHQIRAHAGSYRLQDRTWKSVVDAAND